MGVGFGEEPPYEVVDSNPSFSTVVANFNFTDIATTFGTGALGVPVGYFSARYKALRQPSMTAAVFIGSVGGFLIAYQNSVGRLIGYKK